MTRGIRTRGEHVCLTEEASFVLDFVRMRLRQKKKKKNCSAIVAVINGPGYQYPRKTYKNAIKTAENALIMLNL